MGRIVWALESVRSFIHKHILGKYLQFTIIGTEDIRRNKMKTIIPKKYLHPMFIKSLLTIART